MDARARMDTDRHPCTCTSPRHDPRPFCVLAADALSSLSSRGWAHWGRGRGAREGPGLDQLRGGGGAAEEGRSRHGAEAVAGVIWTAGLAGRGPPTRAARVSSGARAARRRPCTPGTRQPGGPLAVGPRPTGLRPR